MKNSTWIWLLAVLAILIFLFVFRKDKPVINWSEHYKYNSEDPYGTTVFWKLIERKFNKVPVVTNKDRIAQLLANDKAKGSFLYVNKGLWLDSTDLEALLEFVSLGNEAFIATNDFPDELLLSLTPSVCYYNGQEDNSIFYKEAIVHPLTPNPLDAARFNVQVQKEKDTIPYKWKWFPDDLFCGCDSMGHLSLGYINNQPQKSNYIEIPYGEGYFYIHQTPIAFSNIILKKKEALKYFNYVTSFWQIPDTLYIQKETFSPDDIENQPQFQNDSESPLRYILSKKALAAAWYTLLAGVLLFFLFYARRRQRVIPIPPRNENTSLEFVKTLGAIYHQQGKPFRLAVHSLKMFAMYVHERTRIHIDWHSDEWVKPVSERMNIPIEVLSEFKNTWELLHNNKPFNENHLMHLHQQLEKIYFS